MNLQTIKDNYAQEQGYDDWEQLDILSGQEEITKHIDEICIRAQKAALEKAAERLERKIELPSEMGIGKKNWVFAQSYIIITNPENLIT